MPPTASSIEADTIAQAELPGSRKRLGERFFNLLETTVRQTAARRQRKNGGFAANGARRLVRPAVAR